MGNVVRLPWGTWDLETGKWSPNTNVINHISVVDQHKSNLEAGYSCEHARDPVVCKWCNDVRD